MTMPKAWIVAAIVAGVGLLILRGLSEVPRGADTSTAVGMAMAGGGMGNPNTGGANQQRNDGTAK